MAKKKTSFTNMLSGDEMVSQPIKKENERMTRLTLNIPISLKQRMLNHIASTMNTNLSDLTKDAIVRYLDENG